MNRHFSLKVGACPDAEVLLMNATPPNLSNTWLQRGVGSALLTLTVSTARRFRESDSASSNRLLRRRSKSTTAHSTAHSTTAAKISAGFGEKIRMNPFPFTSAEKLDTQNGIRNKRKVCQKSSFTLFALAAVVLMNNAKPIIKLNPNEVSQSRGDGSK